MRFSVLLLAAVTFWCANHAQAAAVTDEVSAQKLISTAETALYEGRSNPNRYMDAVVAYAQVEGWLKNQSDKTARNNIVAALFWAWHQTDDEVRKRYEAERLLDPTATDAIARAKTIITEPSNLKDAEEAYAKAVLFQDGNRAYRMLAAMYFFEVSQRYLNSPVSKRAHERYDDIMRSRAKLIRKDRIDSKESIIPPITAAQLTEPTPKTKAPVPDSAALTLARDAIQDLHKSDYSSSKGRTKLVGTLMEEAKKMMHDPISRFALLSEASDLAISTKQLYAVVVINDLLTQEFDIADPVADLRTNLGKMVYQPAIPALLKLMDVPDDSAANAVVGKWLGLTEQDWPRALPYLARCDDTNFQAPAQSELEKPTTAPAIIAIADTWYELGKKNAQQREPVWRHALSLYERAFPLVTGVTADALEKRIDELNKYLPLGPLVDYEQLTVAQWDKIRGRIYTVNAGKGQLHTGIKLRDGQSLRVVPHPTDTWRISFDKGRGRGSDIDIDTTYKGQSTRRENVIGAMKCRVGDGEELPTGVISGIGELVLYGDIPDSNRFKGTGSIRVKLIPVD